MHGTGVAPVSEYRHTRYTREVPVDQLLRDTRIAFRSLFQRPLFLVTAIVTLALGLGAGTAVFSVVESALLQPLPFRDADRLAVVWGVAGPEQDIRGASPIEIRDWDQAVDALGPLAYYNGTTVNLTGTEGGATQLQSETVSPGFFEVLGVAPTRGRTFVPEDDEPGAAGSVVLSYRLWQERFGGASDVVGRTLRLDDTPFTVVGVMPEGFRGLGFQADVWTPLGPFVGPDAMTDRGTRWLAAVGRLAPGASPEAAQEQLDAAAARLEEAYPDANRARGAQLLSLRDFYVGPTRNLLLMVLGGVALLLLIAAANVANLQLVRAIERRREIAVRYALGAGRGPVARQLVTESVVLGLMGGIAGIALAGAGLSALLPLVPDGVLPPYARPGLDGPVLAFGILTSLAVGVFFGLAPAFRASREAPAQALREGTRGATAGGSGLGRRIGGQQAIIVAEVALALVLLVTAGLAIDSLRRQLALEPGFHADGVLAARISLAGDAYDREGRIQFVDGLMEDLGGLAGVQSVAVTSNAPLRGYNGASYIFRATDPVDADHRIRFYYHPVTPDYFATVGAPIVAGRGFTAADRMDAPGAVLVSEAFAAKVWPGEDALGRRVILGGDTATVVGVAGDVRQRSLTTDLMDPGEDPDVYFAYAQIPVGSFDIVVRTAGDPGTLTGAVRRAVAARDPSIPIYDVAALSDVLGAQTALGRMVSSLLTVFSLVALLMAAVGLYGVLAFVVRGRRRELAIRAALGARPVSIVRLVLRQGLGLVIIGVLVGLGGALLAGRLVAGFLFGVAPVDLGILALTAGALVTVAALASYLPARQATRIDPQAALAEE